MSPKMVAVRIFGLRFLYFVFLYFLTSINNADISIRKIVLHAHHIPLLPQEKTPLESPASNASMIP